MKNGSILILSNDKEIGNSIEGKVKLLRECDNIQQAAYLEAISLLNSSLPSLIIVYSSNKDSVSIVKEIRTLKSLDKVPIILAMDCFIEELLLYAFDNGIDDFFFLNDSDSVVLMRILLCLQKSILYRKLETAQDILSAAGIIEKSSGIYTQEQMPLVLRHFFSKSLEENEDSAVFMCVKPVVRQNKKSQGIQQIMSAAANAVKKIPRGGDIIAYGKDNSFYLILFNAGASGAKSVASRIKHALFGICSIFAAAAEITASFEEMEPVILQSVKDQIDAGVEFSYLYDIAGETSQALNIQDESGKKFTDFKKEFFAAFEQMTSPVMHQIHKQASKLFPYAKITFDITESGSWFRIMQDKIDSSLYLSYPAYTKLIADIKHISGSNAPDIKRQTIDFEDFSSDMLLAMLMNVLREFESRLNAGETKK